MEPEGGGQPGGRGSLDGLSTNVSTNVLSFVQNVVFAAESKEEHKSDMRPHTGLEHSGEG